MVRVIPGTSETFQQAVREAATALATKPVGGQTPAERAHTSLELKTPLLGGQDARPAIESLLQVFGMQRPEELAQVTQHDCFSKCGDLGEAMSLFALVIVVQQHVCGCGHVEPCVLPPRRSPLPDLDVQAYAGAYEARPVPRPKDPFIAIFGDVAPSTPEKPVEIYYVNHGDLDDRTPRRLPGDLAKAKDGRYSFQASEAWMAKEGIKPGTVVEFFQVKKDEAGHELRRSGPTYTKVREGGAVIPAPELPPGDVVGDVKPDANLRLARDPAPTAVRPDRIAATLEGEHLRLGLRGKMPAFETYSQIATQNLANGKAAAAEVAEDGTFNLSIAARKGEPVVLHAVDHTHKAGDPMFERILVLRAGIDETPMLITNPALGMDAPPQIAHARVKLGRGADCHNLVGDRAITPGSLVTVTHVPDVQGAKPESIRGLAGPDGSISIRMPFEVHANDVFDVTVETPFNLLQAPSPEQARAKTTVRYEIDPDGSLDFVSKTGPEHVLHTLGANEAVRPLDNTDRVASATPYLQDARFDLKDFSVSFRPRDWNTGNWATIDLEADRRAQPQVAMRVDNGEVVVTLHSELRGAWPETSAATRPQVGWGRYDGTSSGWQNSEGVGPLQQLLIPKKNGDLVPIRFVREDGSPIAHGHLRAQAGTYKDYVASSLETFSSVSFKLVPESLERG